MNDIALESIGKILEQGQQRDAVHIAVAPAIAGEKLNPGNHVRIWEGEAKAVRIGDRNAVGIVDPYLKLPVQPGQRFYVHLYPGSITSLRHEWTHPAFPPEKPLLQMTMDDAAFLGEYAAHFDKTPEEMIEIARMHAAGDDDFGRTTLPFDTPDEAYSSHADCRQFWEVFQRVTGIDPGERRGHSMFSCAC